MNEESEDEEKEYINSYELREIQKVHNLEVIDSDYTPLVWWTTYKCKDCDKLFEVGGSEW